MNLEEEGMAHHEEPEANQFVGTEDLVHFIDMAFSPAAAYILCTGKVAPNNFGEQLIQASRGCDNRQRAKHFQEKEEGLLSFFAGSPET